jgi:hypothetical protein
MNPVPHWDTMSVGPSRFWISQFRFPWFPCHRKSRNVEPRLLQILGHASLRSNGSDSIGKSRIAISLCKSFTTPETPISRTPTLRDLSPHVLGVWMARILSGNRGSRFQYARVSCLRKPLFSDSRFFEISRHVSLRRLTAEILRGGFETQKVSILSTCKTPMPSQNADTCPTEINV